MTVPIKDYRPYTFTTHTLDRTPTFLGFELEVVGPDIESRLAQHRLWDLAGTHQMVQFRDDCSLRYIDTAGQVVNGTQHVAELVSDPFTETYYRRGFREHLTAWLLRMAADGFGVNYTCGMHLHVSTTAFTDADHQDRFLWVWNEDPDQTKALSGRDWVTTQHANHYCWFAEGDRAQRRETIRERDGGLAAVQRREWTIEVRWPGATLDPAVFHRHIEAVWAGVAYTTDKTFDEVTFADFRAYVGAHAEQYPALAPALP